MDSLLRNEQRERGLRPMPMPVPVQPSSPAARRPPPVPQRPTNAAVIDLTQDDVGGRPASTASYPSAATPSNGFMHMPDSSLLAAMQSGRAGSTGRPAPSAGNTPNSWQLPAKNKHSAPSKVRMFDPTAPTTSTSSAAGPSKVDSSPLPMSKTYRATHGVGNAGHHSARQLMHEGVQVVKHAIRDGFTRLEHAIDQANAAHPNGHNGSQSRPNAHPFSSMGGHEANDDDDDEKMPSAFAGPTLTAEEREQQLQEMLTSMVLPPELGDIDLEKASSVEGLKCKLLPHQVAGYLWLKGREGGKYKGGILADDMGLGKTVQMLALIVGNAPDAKDTTINKIRSEPETKNAKKKKKNVIPDAEEDTADQSVKEELIEIKSKTTLIVAPLAVIRQWEREIKEKTSPNLKVLVHHGTSRTKTATAFAKYDVVITTYPTIASEWNNVAGLEKPKKGAKKGKKGVVVDSSEDDDSDDNAAQASDSEDDSFDGSMRPGTKKKAPKKSAQAPKKLAPAPLFDANWLRIVLDEAQNIKNHRTKASSACAALSRNALSKWCLSGTPIQNEAMEMFSLIRFLAIPPFNEHAHFREKISDPLKSSNQNRVNWGMKRLCAVLTTIMLRRTKDTVHDGKPILTLPERSVNVISTDFDDEGGQERAFYDDLESQVKRNFENAEEAGTKVNHMVTLLMLLRLRQACSHPSLISRNVQVDAGAASGASTQASKGEPGDMTATKDDDDDDGLADLLAGLSVASKRCDRCQVPLSRPQAASGQPYCDDCLLRVQSEQTTANRSTSKWDGTSSTKIRQMLRILDEVRKEGNGEKTIVFSQFTSFMDLLEPFLRQEGHAFVRYDGSMRPDERERALDTIKSDANDVRVILISFKAGNVGLNLTCCSRVILMDLWWNPMLEAQSIDRAHRLGQTRNVYVYKLVIRNSVEERILALQDKKRALAEAALEGSKLSKANKLDKKELMFLFRGGPVA